MQLSKQKMFNSDAPINIDIVCYMEINLLYNTVAAVIRLPFNCSHSELEDMLLTNGWWTLFLDTFLQVVSRFC